MHHRVDLDLGGWRPERPPVVLLGGLNLARALGVAGIPVVVASSDKESPAFASRYCSAGVVLPPLERLDVVAEKVARLGERLRGALGARVPLFYGDDDYLNLVLQYRERFARYFRFIVNDPDVSAALIEKERFDAFARSRGLPVPRMLDWNELASTSGPVLVKPKVKMAFEDSPVFVRLLGRAGKARIFASARAVLEEPLARALKDDLIFQEYIPGDDRQIWSFHGYADEESRMLAWFIGRKIRTYPALTGVSTYLELAHHAGLAELGHQIVARVPLKGVFKIDFKQDPRNGRFVMLEVNARYNLWHYLGARNGVNIPLAACEYLLEGKRARVPARFGTAYRWVSLKLDYRAFRDLASRGELGFWRWIASLIASRKVYDLFAWTDPLPLIARLLRGLRNVPRKTVRFTRWPFKAS